MRYFLDTEFSDFRGELVSLALVREDGISLYFIMHPEPKCSPWVRENVLPILLSVPHTVETMCLDDEQAAVAIEAFFRGDSNPLIITDWPDDVRYFCELLTPEPGCMIDIPGIRFEVVRVDSYPTDVQGAVQHNAWWDAMAMRSKFGCA